METHLRLYPGEPRVSAMMRENRSAGEALDSAFQHAQDFVFSQDDQIFFTHGNVRS